MWYRLATAPRMMSNPVPGGFWVNEKKKNELGEIDIEPRFITYGEPMFVKNWNKLFKKINIFNERVRLFSFTDNDFIKLNAIVCRPGIGILTDCIKYNIPPIAIDDNTNLEISNNALKVERDFLYILYIYSIYVIIIICIYLCILFIFNSY